MDVIFKALNDRTRRDLLDMLRIKDGQTLTDLETKLGMTRFGVMKHLKVLEEASLIVSRKSGRFKYHYLNAVPLQEVIDRWIDPLLQKPLARQVIDLKEKLEGKIPMNVTTKKPDFILETYIQTTAAALWQALTDGEIFRQHHFAMATIKGDVAVGNTLEFITPDGGTMITTEITKSDPPNLLDMTFQPGWMGPDAEKSRCVYLIEEAGDNCKLTIEHYDIPPGHEGFGEGWTRVAASVKSYLETGSGLSFPPMGG